MGAMVMVKPEKIFFCSTSKLLQLFEEHHAAIGGLTLSQSEISTLYYV
jgi:hypothetical protein